MRHASSSSEEPRRKRSPRFLDWGIAAAVALAVSIGIGANRSTLAGLSVDILYWLRTAIAPVHRDPARSRSAIVSIDEETYRTPPFINYPTVLWTHELASVLNALIAADAKVVAFDIVFPASIEPFVPGFDRDFLLALHNAAAVGKVVLGEVQHQKWPVHPFQAQSFAVGNQKNIRAVNFFSDSDRVIRRIPLTFERENGHGGTTTEPSMALEVAARAAGTRPERLPGGGWALAGYRIPGSRRNNMMLNFADRDAIPSYSFADLEACAAKDDAAFFRKHFAGKAVYIGAVLDIEDRKLTSMRFVTAPDRASTGERCVHSPITDFFREDLKRETIAGVVVLATATNNLLDGDALRELPPMADFGIVLLIGLGAGFTTMARRPPAAGLILLAGGALWVLGATYVFRAGLVLPLVAPLLAAGLTFALLLGHRFALTDRDKRLVRNSFKLYLAPAVVDRLLEQDRLPELGGEVRPVTVMLSDLQGFSALSEHLAPAQLVALMNEYLSAMSEVIEAEGGFIDKYIGDAIVAVFGAPLADAQHALHAVRAALRCRDRLAELNRQPGAFLGHRLKARIGLGTGEAVVGNVGSRRRFNYTVMGDIVNLTARLEGANKIYGTTILANAATHDAAGGEIAWREIDRVRVVGRENPESLFEPVGLADRAAAAEPERHAAFARALAEYRAGNFAAALELFEALAGEDPVARLFAERSRRWLSAPPPQPWDAVTTLESK